MITTDNSQSVDVNSRQLLFAAIYLGIIGPAIFIVQPGFVQGLVEYAGFSERQAGYIASAEMWGIAITTLLMSFIASRVNWRQILIAATLLMVAGNLLSLWAESAVNFALVRALTGIGSGVLVSLTFTIIGLTANPDRNFGYLIMWILVYGAAGFIAMPMAYPLVGMDGVLIFFALFSLSGLAVVRYLPCSGDDHIQTDEQAVDLPLGLKWLAIATMFVYFLAQGVVWAYLYLMGTHGGASEQAVANGLTLSQFLGIAGAFTAAMLGCRLGRISPLSIGIAGSLVSLLFLFGRLDVWLYGFAVCLFNFAWNMTHPFLLAALASFDRSGRLVVHGVAAQMLGLAVGPAIAASIIGEQGYGNVIWLGIVLFALSLLLILPPLLVQRKTASR
jgi:predicted MFS family arabinose efflux permease